MVAKPCVLMQGRLQQLGSITVSITTSTAVTQLLANARLTGGSLSSALCALHMLLPVVQQVLVKEEFG